jgi:hypothetical protein
MRKELSAAYHLTILLFLLACPVSFIGCPGDFGPRYIVRIDRNFSSPQEENLILIAENTYPSPEDVVELYPVGTDPDDLPENVWWYFDDDETFRLPYAITTGAIEHYTQKVYDDEANQVLPESAPFPGALERLIYSATIQHFPTIADGTGEIFTNAYRVTMQFDWKNSEEINARGAFHRYRKVFLTPEGQVLKVEGDGPLAFPVR